MCMTPGCSGGHKSGKSSGGYTPKKAGGSKASKGTYSPRSRSSTMSSFGKPTVTNFKFGAR